MNHEIKVKVIREKRKTMVLRMIDPENAQVKAPLSVSDKRIGEFVKSKGEWLAKMSKKMNDYKSFSQTFDLLKNVYVDGLPVMKAEEISIGFEKLPVETQKKLLRKEVFYFLNILLGKVVIGMPLLQETDCKLHYLTLPLLYRLV